MKKAGENQCSIMHEYAVSDRLRILYLIVGLIACMAVMYSSLSMVSAQTSSLKAALVVKDRNRISEMHERRVLTVLEDMGFDVTLVDKNTIVEYRSFDLIVVAGRPMLAKAYLLDDFVANIPVNEVPTIGIGLDYAASWGWYRPPGADSLVSSRPQAVYILKEHPLTYHFFEGERFDVHTIQGYNMIDIVDGYTNMNSVASGSSLEKFGVIRYATPGTILQGGKSISSDSAAVYFGITYPIYWTDSAEQLFRNAVTWLTSDSDKDGMMDFKDNCAFVANPSQSDIDLDGMGDACDAIDSRPDLAVMSIALPTSRVECEDMEAVVTVKNFGYNDADSYRIRVIIATQDSMGIIVENNYEAAGSLLSSGQQATTKFVISADDMCGIGKKTVTATVFQVSPPDLYEGNNVAFVKVRFTVARADVDGDGTLEQAMDRNSEFSDGYEYYFDPNGNSNGTKISGDADGRWDYLIDASKDGTLDKYWDPDDGVLTDVHYLHGTNGTITGIIEIDFDGDGDYDILFDTNIGSVQYLDLTSPLIGSLGVDPTYGQNTWYKFTLSSTVSDMESGIEDESCEYTLDGTNWVGADFINSDGVGQDIGTCIKQDVFASIGQDLTIAMRVKNKAGITAVTDSLQRKVAIRSLSIDAVSDKVSYQPGENVVVYGHVMFSDNSIAVPAATVSYSTGSYYGQVLSGSDGSFVFQTKAPSVSGPFSVAIDAQILYAQGSYMLQLNAPSSSTTTTTTDQAGPASTGGSSSGTSMYSLMLLDTPTEVFGKVGGEVKFVAKVRNIDNVILRETNIMVLTSSPYVSYTVSPSFTDIYPGHTQDYEVTVRVSEDLPSSEIGKMVLQVRAFSRETGATNSISLQVSENITPAMLSVQIGDMPVFKAGKDSMIELTFKNTGGTTTRVSEKVSFPDGWKIAKEISSFDLEPGEERKGMIIAVPSNFSGTIGFDTTFVVGDKLVTLMDSREVLVVSDPSGNSDNPFDALTGMFSNAFGVAGWYLVAGFLIALAAIVAISRFGKGTDGGNAVRKGISSLLDFFTETEEDSVKKSAYSKWERSYRKAFKKQ
jgi:hypothetical protein